MKGRFTELLASKYATHALDYIFTNPVFRNSRFTKNAGIPSHTAGRQSAVYAFAPLLNLVKN